MSVNDLKELSITSSNHINLWSTVPVEDKVRSDA